MFLGTALADEGGAVLTESGLRFKARNPFRQGDQIDWITPDGNVSFELKTLYDEKGFPVREAQTNHIVTIPVPESLLAQPEALEWSIIRGREHASDAG